MDPHAATPPLDEALHAAELLELGDAFFELDRHWRIVRVNGRQELLSRKPRVETVGRTFAEVWPELATPESRYWQEYRRCMEERVPVQFQEHYAPLDLWTGVTAYPVSGGGIAVFFRDIGALKRAEQAVSAREGEASSRAAELEAVLSAVADGVLVYDLEGRIVRSNAAADAILGYGGHERAMPITGRLAATRTEWFRDDGAPVVPEEMAPVAAARSGARLRGQVLRARRDGEDRWISFSAAPLVVRGARIGAVVSLSDITERTRVEQEVQRGVDALRASEERFRLLSDTMPQIVCVLRSDGTAEYVNPAWVAFSGLDLAATRSLGWVAVLHPDDLPAARACRVRALKLQVPQQVELRYRAADGSFRWYLSRLAPVVEGGRVARLVGAAMEIEDRKRAEEALRDGEARARAISDNVRDLLVVLEAVRDGSGAVTGWRYEDANDAALELLETTRDALVGRTLAEILPERAAAAAERLARVLATGVAEQYEHGTRGRTLLIKLFRISRGCVGSAAVDITDRKRAEEALRDANARLRDADRRKDEFLGMLSHELRNPLAPIRNALYILDHAAPTGEQARRAKEVANRQIAHITRLVDDLLDVTRIARGKIELRRALLDLSVVARRTADDYRDVMAERGIELEVDVPPERVPVSGDETRLAQVLGNLLSNAAKFTPGRGRVSLALRAEGDRAVVHVRDNGPGITAEVLPTIFEPFTQGQQTLARSEGGLGLGLALVKGLVALHGGEVGAASDLPGGGADFTVTLPLASPRGGRAGAAAPVGASRPAVARRVLIVDDNRDAADTLAQLVTMRGHRAVVAYDPYAALALASAELPDVVLCDIGLPGMDGYELARQLRALSARHEVRLVALSGYAQPEDVARATEAGFDAHVAKPPSPEELEQMVEAHGP